ncbi:MULTISPECIES: ExbD/TolR family protein [Acidithiobacillus]|jgi:biopolymer transport protein ExbD|uniref:Biopolymer transport protein, ExbD/TolR family n=2 Tax=Acidithiobacillus ferrooxidans TaxID=920 RepID=B7JA63_ACIF2|nr:MULTISPECIES: biopolymer transporter ExbD [Acidithiobacillus]ACH83439.1 Biopolymer transport protein ExbD/TolR [Acidithiobacillus ferrooxidans ATCC 53993]ACK80143.1 biopolymer transport protein, ExbD/TolR family [Acidithiobacillus ferrooxidans ATCC 23270]MBN6744715.1 biopolymer transporter ExbD [Acidithiobacillus sp. MC2.2]MBN6747675.1 biopolymer transporter ExbD [Acidithiobacillus sp. PG05]MBU2774967.1 biopolymer transporter ExbD [Acidithiobacillus ferrooxidans]
MRYFEARKGRIEIIPMIDIMLFLLVFFIMITLRMIPASGISTRLPTSSSAQVLPRTPLVVELRSDGSLHFRDKTVSLSQLEQQLARNDLAHTQVILAGAKTVTLQQLVAVMDACRHAGISQMGIATRAGQP